MINTLFAYLDLNWLRLTRKVELYQPSVLNNFTFPLVSSYTPKRQCQDRLDAINSNLNFQDINSCLDIGSQLGFFTFKLAQIHKLTAFGIDHDVQAIRYAKNLETLNQSSQTSFMHLSLTPQTATMLPQVDLILFLDVFHHLIWLQGFDAADQIFKTIISKCKYLVFETGQADEPDQPWTKSLKLMGDNANHWLDQYLHKYHLKIIHQSEMSTHLTSVNRSFYICEVSS